jgi:hypothetical protein
MIKSASTDLSVPPPSIIIVQNWFDEVNRFVPANRSRLFRQ